MQPVLHFLIPLLLLAAVQGRAQSPARPLRIAVIGSSTAAGTGAHPADSAWVNRYRAFLQALDPANEVINLARGGYQTYHLMPDGFAPPPGRPGPDTLRNISRALSLFPDAILINLPSNDAAAGYCAAEQVDNFETIAHTAWAAGVPVWISSTQPRQFDSGKVNIQLRLLDWIRNRFGMQALDFWTGIALPNGLPDPRLGAGDGIHLNNAGHRLLFERVAAAGIPERLQCGKWNLQDSLWATALPLAGHPFPAAPVKKGLSGALRETFLVEAEQPMAGATVEVLDVFGQSRGRQVQNLPAVVEGWDVPGGVYRVRVYTGSRLVGVDHWVK